MERFSASQATKFMNCHGSANLDLAIPNWVPPVKDETADNAANRGTRMHAMFAEVMSLSTKDTRMMAEAIAFVAEIRARRRFKVLVELHTQAVWLKSNPSTTADLVLYVQDEIHVFDLKTGTIPVSAFENNQLMYYALTYGPLAPKAKGVNVHIVQPWADNMESWFVSAARLAQFRAAALATEQAILAHDTTLVPGDHCQFCPANPHGRGARGTPSCPAMLQLLYPQVAVDEDAMFKEDE